MIVCKIIEYSIKNSDGLIRHGKMEFIMSNNETEMNKLYKRALKKILKEKNLVSLAESEKEIGYEAK